MAVRDLFVSPDSYMERKVKKTSLRREFVLILVLGSFGAVGIAYVGTEALSALEGSGDRIRFNFIGFALESIVGMLVLWVGAGVVTHWVANRVYDGRGSLRRLIKASAWAYIPLGIGNLVRSVTVFLAFQGKELPSNPEGVSPDEQTQNILEVGMDEPVIMAGTVILLLTAVYSGYLLSFAIKRSKDISQEDALKTAAVPILLFVLYIAQGLV